jgi:hypothetical protein
MVRSIAYRLLLLYTTHNTTYREVERLGLPQDFEWQAEILKLRLSVHYSPQQFARLRESILNTHMNLQHKPTDISGTARECFNTVLRPRQLQQLLWNFTYVSNETFKVTMNSSADQEASSTILCMFWNTYYLGCCLCKELCPCFEHYPNKHRSDKFYLQTILKYNNNSVRTAL